VAIRNSHYDGSRETEGKTWFRTQVVSQGSNLPLQMNLVTSSILEEIGDQGTRLFSQRRIKFYTGSRVHGIVEIICVAFETVSRRVTK
jgi:hypothetical protein